MAPSSWSSAGSGGRISPAEEFHHAADLAIDHQWEAERGAQPIACGHCAARKVHILEHVRNPRGRRARPHASGQAHAGAKLHVRLASSNALKLSDGRDHVPTQRKTRARWSTFQNAPYPSPGPDTRPRAREARLGHRCRRRQRVRGLVQHREPPFRPGLPGSPMAPDDVVHIVSDRMAVAKALLPYAIPRGPAASC
jgi:hypothetical protein